MLILGIESSCDETAASVLKDGRVVLSSVVSSQIDIHAEYGGVIPEIAAREHLKNIDPLVEMVLSSADVKLSDIDAVAVTQGPGLIGALLVGVSYAKGLCAATSKPLIPVDHVHAHLHGALLGVEADDFSVFPCLGLVVSGGHTNLYYMKDSTSFNLIAHSVDDACGECFDKIAKLLKQPYPGGAYIEKHARTGNPKRFAMPKVVNDKQKLVFSYSGLKTHMVNLISSMDDATIKAEFSNIAASFQEEALGQIARKLKQALSLYSETKSVVIAGGVAANGRFRELLGSSLSVPVHFPALKYCSDNAAMIAALGHKLFELKKQFDSNWDAYSRYEF